MKIGRNDPCHCGSGKKFKKCCLGKADQNAPLSRDASPFPASISVGSEETPTWHKPVSTEEPTTKLAPQPNDPLQLKWDAIWDEFNSQQGEAREAVFLRTLDDESTDDEAAFEMLNKLHEDARERDELTRFDHMVETLAERRPELYQKSSHYYLSWQLLDAVTYGRPDVLSLTQALATKAGQDLDIVDQGLAALAYHGHLTPLVEALRIGWPFVRKSKNVMDWAIGEFANASAAYEMYAYVEAASSPDPTNGELLERIRYFIEEPRLDYVANFISDLSGKQDSAWMVADFDLSPAKKARRQHGRDDHEQNEGPADRGSQNLFRLITQFVGYLRSVEQIPYPRGELIRHELHSYFVERHQGGLNPRLSLFDQMRHPKKELPRPPKPSHPLCPERVTFEVCLAQLFGFMNAQYHKAAALFQVVPSWLRFLQLKNLIDDAQRVQTLDELRPLHASLLKTMKTFTQDPTPYRSLQKLRDAP